MRETVVELLVLVGAMFVLLAGLGVLRFPDVYARMHAVTKASTLGIALIGIAAALSLEGGRAKALAAVAFIFITAPSAAHFIGRTAYFAEGIQIELAGPDDLATVIEKSRERPN